MDIKKYLISGNKVSISSREFTAFYYISYLISIHEVEFQSLPENLQLSTAIRNLNHAPIIRVSISSREFTAFYTDCRNCLNGESVRFNLFQRIYSFLHNFNTSTDWFAVSGFNLFQRIYSFLLLLILSCLVLESGVSISSREFTAFYNMGYGNTQYHFRSFNLFQRIYSFLQINFSSASASILPVSISSREFTAFYLMPFRQPPNECICFNLFQRTYSFLLLGKTS